MRVLVTAGPTHEFLDAVRFLSSPSSGRMGFACAIEAARRGHRVTLVTGPVPLPDPAGVKTIRVVSARQMHRAVLKEFSRVDAVIMTAAVSDYRPAVQKRTKIKKGSGPVTLRLVRNPDILEELGRRKRHQVLIGFALEVQDGQRKALEKYRRKNLDCIVLNDPRSFGSERMDATVYGAGGLLKRFRRATKRSVAAWIVRRLEI